MTNWSSLVHLPRIILIIITIIYLQVAKENADVVIMDDNFTTIVNVAKWGRAVYINIQKFVQFQLTVNVVALMTNFVSACASGDISPSIVCFIGLLFRTNKLKI